jgi:hypothetical protein
MSHEECVHQVAGAACFQCFVLARALRADAPTRRADATAHRPDAMNEERLATDAPARLPLEPRRDLTPADLQHRRRMLMHLTIRGLALRLRRS